MAVRLLFSTNLHEVRPVSFTSEPRSYVSTGVRCIYMLQILHDKESIRCWIRVAINAAITSGLNFGKERLEKLEERREVGTRDPDLEW